jgi:hypothetical protein
MKLLLTLAILFSSALVAPSTLAAVPFRPAVAPEPPRPEETPTPTPSGVVNSTATLPLTAVAAAPGIASGLIYPALYPPLLVKSSRTSPLVLLLNEVERLKNAAALDVERIDARLKLLNTLKGEIEDLKKKTKAKAAKDGEVAKKGEELKKHKKGSPEYKKTWRTSTTWRKRSVTWRRPSPISTTTSTRPPSWCTRRTTRISSRG